MRHTWFLCLLTSVLLCSSLVLLGLDDAPSRDKANQLIKNGNWKEAYDQFAKLALNPQDDPRQVSTDFTQAQQCLQRLGRISELDAFREKVLAAHAKNWRLLQTVAQSYVNVEHWGAIIAGEYIRGPHRGGTARFVDSFERDRTRGLQLMQQALPLLAGETEKSEVGQFYLNLADMLMTSRQGQDAWRLQYLSDLKTLPDYEDSPYRYSYYRGGYGSGGRGAPTDADGKPIYHTRPKSWQAAQTDGQRWRWCLMQAIEFNPAITSQVQMHFAQFLWNQFGVQTMAQYGYFFGRQADDEKKDQSGPYALATLGEDETIARLAIGIRRFKVPDEFNFIKIYKDVSARNDAQSTQARRMLGSLFENRQQYPKAADWWRQAALSGEPNDMNHVTQIVGNWGMFEPVMTQPAGEKGATVDFRFRNGKKVQFVAHEILIDKLISDVKAYLKTNPAQLNWEKVDIAQIGYRLVQDKQKEYQGKEVARWSEDLKPRPNHFDRRITVHTPLKAAGAYLLTSQIENGNTCFIVLWVADTAIVKKQLDKQVLLFVADARTGEPLPKMNVEMFGYWQEWKGNNNHQVHTQELAEFTNADGQIVLAENRCPQRYQWIIQARGDQGQPARYAWLGWTGVWYAQWYDAQYNATKVFFISDRPVYRPGNAVKFKFWVNQAQYDREGKSPYAGSNAEVVIRNPKNEEVYKKTLPIDEFGGFADEWTPPKDATLGSYYVQAQQPNRWGGGGQIRIEEYKKPEFEVTVEAPKEPVMLGEKVTATIQAKYLFGAPVKEGKVKYKVTRSSFQANWYPMAPWDWYYGPGYWWFAYDYAWYPGWGEWGCRRPTPWWWWQGRWAPPQQPEIVSENEVPVGPDGTVKVEIDTTLAKTALGDQDHKYEISAEVTDQSRRTITGSGAVMVARKPFKVYAWVDRGHFRVGDDIRAHFRAQTLDNKGVQGKGSLKLLQITYDKDRNPVEKAVQTWVLPTDAEGNARQQIKASAPGQYRLSYTVTDSKNHAIEGGYVFVIAGEGFDGSQFRFNDLELVTDKKEYQPDDKVKLLVNTNRDKSTVLLFVRPSNGVCLPPKTLRLTGKSAEETIAVLKKDMPNFYVEALTISDGMVHQEMREIVVPPEKRILTVQVTPLGGQADDAKSDMKFKPGQKAKVQIKLTDQTGEPCVGSAVVTMYDKGVEYISGGSNVPDIREFFWKWRRSHNLQVESSLARGGNNMIRPHDKGMGFLGVFGSLVADLPDAQGGEQLRGGMGGGKGGAEFGARALKSAGPGAMADGAPMALAGAPMAPMAANRRMAFAENGMAMDKADRMEEKAKDGKPGAGGEGSMAEAAVRTKFADTAFWAAAVTTGKNGTAEVEITMPENLTTWKTKVWAMGDGTRVGQGDVSVLTTKNLIIRLQAPRFFVEKDEVVLSANVHNYLKTAKSAKVILDLEGKTLDLMPGVVGEQTVRIDAGGEKRVDWRVKVPREGAAIVRMKALTDEESDAMQMEFPVYVHGMLKMDSKCGVIRPDKNADSVTMTVPAERRPDQTRLEIRYSPTLAGAMVDALPYLVEYPYGCTEQTLNHFLPTVITQKVIQKTGIDLKELQKKITNLNAQEIGDDVKRAADWQRLAGTMRWDGKQWVKRNPVYDIEEVDRMVKAGLEHLYSMQCSDGGWGWFSGWGEHSYPHTTALVVHGLQIARSNDVAVVPGAIQRGIDWLKQYQADQVRRLNLPVGNLEHKAKADALDAFVYMVLVDEKSDNLEMREFLYRDRIDLPVYAKSMFGIALHRVNDVPKRDMIIRNIEQYLVQDNENFTAYLRLPENNWWWCWYGSEYEAQAYYLKLLAVTQPNSEKASRLVKYLINNRRHATYWNSTRDTAVVIEAFADYIKASGEDKPDMTVEILIDGQMAKQVKINKDNLFTFDNKVVVEGVKLTSGPHKIDFRKTGTGPLYWNAYLTNFTLEDYIKKAGLEIKVERKFYKLTRVDKTVKAEGSHGQVLDQKVEKYDRKEIADLAQLTSGDLVQIEMVIESKNDYEYILIEDMKAAGFEPVDLRSGYNGNEMGAYVEFRDERVVFFVRALARGKHSLSYRMRAEIPGKFSALPAKASAMYAPELKANSDEIKIKIVD